uniref:Uncharacterized protein n=1 Tax=Vespula pensylvanica TaxID=30213 RepID=A0A834P6N9_VESPE|nr:hypothetical protein H0235_005899 [Vespula pensylvanica]
MMLAPLEKYDDRNQDDRTLKGNVCGRPGRASFRLLFRSLTPRRVPTTPLPPTTWLPFYPSNIINLSGSFVKLHLPIVSNLLNITDTSEDSDEVRVSEKCVEEPKKGERVRLESIVVEERGQRARDYLHSEGSDSRSAAEPPPPVPFFVSSRSPLLSKRPQHGAPVPLVPSPIEARSQ